MTPKNKLAALADPETRRRLCAVIDAALPRFEAIRRDLPRMLQHVIPSPPTMKGIQ